MVYEFKYFNEEWNKKNKIMLEFKDLKFSKKETGGQGACLEFENGLQISVQGSSMNYCTPREDLEFDADYSSFEVAVFGKDGEWMTNSFTSDVNDVLGWKSRDEITELMKLIQIKVL